MVNSLNDQALRKQIQGLSKEELGDYLIRVTINLEEYKAKALLDEKTLANLKSQKTILEEKSDDLKKANQQLRDDINQEIQNANKKNSKNKRLTRQLSEKEESYKKLEREKST